MRQAAAATYGALCAVLCSISVSTTGRQNHVILGNLVNHDLYFSREISIAEQVDYLLKQATSVDNLCNMYEGWTPWI